MASKTTLRVAQELLDRFFRDAEGKTNRKLDVYYTLDSLQVAIERGEPALEFLISRGLINRFGADVAFLTDKGAQAVIDEMDLGVLPQEIRDFAEEPPAPPLPSGAMAPVSVETAASGSMRPAAAAPTGESPRPNRATLTHIDLGGQEFAVELGVRCTIGRTDGNTIQINDKRASKSHADISYESGQFILRDLESANGTLVNGDYVVQPIVLKHDDEIVIGRTMLLFTAPKVLSAPIDRAAAAAGFRVVLGTPAEPAPSRPDFGGYASTPPVTDDLDPPAGGQGSSGYARSEATADLFAEPPRDGGDGDGLFDRRSAASAGDLFDANPPAESADQLLFPERAASNLFDPNPPAAPPADQDLFAAPAPEASPAPSQSPVPSRSPMPSRSPVPSRSPMPSRSPVPRAPGAYTPSPAIEVTSLADGLQADLQEPLEELEPFESLDDAAEVDWAQEASGASGPLLENQPVMAPQDALEAAPEGATMARPQTDDMATLMVSREDLFGEDAARAEATEPPTWGEADAHPAFGDNSGAGAAMPASDGMLRLVEAAEHLPSADTSLSSLAPPRAPTSRPTENDALGQSGQTFVEILQALRGRLDQVDVPEKGALIEAVDVLSQHPFVRVVLGSRR